MSLHPPLPIAERILMFGDTGTGKTTSWLDIAKWAARTQSPAHFYVLDTDASVGRMLPSYPEIIPNLTLSPGYEWSDYKNFLTLVMSKAQPHDWVIIDFIGDAWKAVQNFFTEEVFHQDIGNYFLELRKDNKSKVGLEGWQDYGVINPLYYGWSKPLFYKSRFNIFATAKSDALSGDRAPTESQAFRSLFQRYGVKPIGQKELPFSFHTVLLSNAVPGSNQKTLVTVKDRERKLLTGEVVKSFTQDYLIGVAEWSLV